MESSIKNKQTNKYKPMSPLDSHQKTEQNGTQYMGIWQTIEQFQDITLAHPLKK
jgi:hypothetical protein